MQDIAVPAQQKGEAYAQVVGAAGGADSKDTATGTGLVPARVLHEFVITGTVEVVDDSEPLAGLQPIQAGRELGLNH